MTQEEKQLLLKDLCARLPYKTLYAAKNINYGFLGKHYIEDIYVDSRGNRTFCLSAPYSVQGIENIMPYLRPMSSMTEEEIKTYHSYCECNDGDFNGEILYFDTIKSFDYLTSIHIDCRGLIPMGLALKAPADMYKQIKQ